MSFGCRGVVGVGLWGCWGAVALPIVGRYGCCLWEQHCGASVVWGVAGERLVERLSGIGVKGWEGNEQFGQAAGRGAKERRVLWGRLLMVVQTWRQHYAG